MSWLTDRLAAGRTARPFPVAPLAARLGIHVDDPQLVARLATRLGLDAGWVRRCRTLGLTLGQADEWAGRADLHPMNVWPAYGRELYGTALANANRSVCQCGQPYDRIDGRGRRTHSACDAERVRRHRRKAVNPQVTAAVTRIDHLEQEAI